MRGGPSAFALGIITIFAASAPLSSLLVPYQSGSPTPPPSGQYAVRDPILIDGDAAFTRANGVTGGRGTVASPYLIDGWQIAGSSSQAAITVRNTRAPFAIRDVYLTGYSGWTDAIDLVNVSNGRVETSIVSGGVYGLLVQDSSFVAVVSNNLTTYWSFVRLLQSDNVTVANNVIASSLILESSTDVAVTSNTFTNLGILWLGSEVRHFATHTITPDNLRDGVPIDYRVSCAGLNVDRIAVAQLLIADCTRVRVSNLTVTGAFMGIALAFVRDAVVTDTNLSSGSDGMRVIASANVTITRNRIQDNVYGLNLFSSTGIRVFHNDFFRNDEPAYDDGGNAWDDGYPTGGNFWDGHWPVDRCRGRDQTDCTGSDGIADEPFYVKGALDRYPLTAPVTFVNLPPVATFTIPPDRFAGEPVRINGSASYDPDGTITMFAFDCGDGVWGGWGESRDCIFPTAGVYNVTLLAKDNVGAASTFTMAVSVRAPRTAPVASFRPSVWSALSGTAITFDASGSYDAFGAIVEYRWDFGDGETATGISASHAYVASGSYEVRLTVTNDRMVSSSTSATVVIVVRPMYATVSHSLGFEILAPTAWAVEKDRTFEGETIPLVLLGPVRNGVQTNVIVGTEQDSSIQETPAYVASLAEATLSAIRQDRPDARLIEPTTFLTIAGHAAFVLKVQYGNDLIVQEVAIVLSDADDRFWGIILTTDESIASAMDEIFQEMLQGFSITTVPLTRTDLPNFLVLGIFAGAAVAIVVLALLVVRSWRTRAPKVSAPVPMPPTDGSLAVPLYPYSVRPDVLYCVNCGTPAKVDQNFCGRCGTRVQKPGAR